MFRFVDGIVHLEAFTPANPAADESEGTFPRPFADLPFFELAKGGKIVQVADSEINPEYGDEGYSAGSGFSQLVVRHR